MANFLAYFDLLGYKKFIENNTVDHLDYRTNHFARNIERALALDQPNIQSKKGDSFLSDISQSTLNCLTFSDTVIFWTTSNAFNDFEEILKVAHRYNYFNIMHDFPSRGCIVYGDIWFKPFDEESQRGGRYMLNMIYGRALIDAHIRAEAMSWAGCELSSSAIEFANTLGDITPLLQQFTMPYDIPFKTKQGEVRLAGHALRLLKSRALITKYYEEGIKGAFTQDNKGDIEGRTKVIFDNTIEFLKAHQINFPFHYLMSGESATQLFGKLDADYNHTIVKVVQDGQKVNYNIEVTKFDQDNSNRDFLDAEEISPEIFITQLKKAQ